jgi:LmbE family N-acetylglucosaminyl deacetylase
MRPLICFALLAVLFAASLSARSRPEIVYPQLSAPQQGKRILIVAPHIDDEAIGAAGYTYDATMAGAEVFIVYLTAGDHSRTALVLNRIPFGQRRDLIRRGNIRMGEAERAGNVLGLDRANIILLGYPDRALLRMLNQPQQVIRSAATRKRAVPYRTALTPGAPYTFDNLESDLWTIIRELRPDVVIAPTTLDAHADHRAAAILTDAILGAAEWRGERLGYLVHARRFPAPFRFASGSPLLPPPHLRGLDWTVYPLTPETEKKKHQVLASFRTQRRSPYLYLLLQSHVRQNELFLRSPTIGAGSMVWSEPVVFEE